MFGPSSSTECLDLGHASMSRGIFPLDKIHFFLPINSHKKIPPYRSALMHNIHLVVTLFHRAKTSIFAL